MALFARSLAPHGVAFVSYNALPGARLRTMLREMALLHAGDVADRAAARACARAVRVPRAVVAGPAGRVRRGAGERARAAAAAPAGGARARRPRRALRAGLAARRRRARRAPRAALPRRRRAGRAARRPPAARRRRRSSTRSPSGDRVVWEQYADMLAGRAFRQTLLCRADAPVDDVDRSGAARRGCGSAPPSAPGSERRQASEAASRSRRRRTADGSTATARPARRPVARLALARPRSLAVRRAARRSAREPDALAAELWRAFRAGEVELSAAPDRHVTVAGDAARGEPGRPLAGGARAGADEPRATTRSGSTTRSGGSSSGSATARATARRSPRRSSPPSAPSCS